ncbi:hypothetical protein BH10ACI1_BH10ACI1_16230 [soil metagenome]
MTDIWINFTDEDGYPKRVLVECDDFVIGRHSDNDLCIPDNRLSRQHLRIERFGEKITVSDCGSSNGTTLNCEDLFESETLRHGDILNLGGGVEIKVEIVSEPQAESVAPVAEKPSESFTKDHPQPAAQNASVSFGGVSSNFFYIAPALGLVILLFVGGLFFAFSGNADNNPNNEISDSRTPIEATPRKTPSRDKTPSVSPSPTNSGDNLNTTQPPTTNDPTQTPVVSTEIEKIKQNAAEFMRRIAQNDTAPFLKTDQAEKVSQKINSLKNSSALVENLRAVGRDKSQFESLANSQNLKPQFLAAAALNEIGNRSGDPTETAKTMLPILSKLKIPLGNDFANDNLLIIAAYNQGKSGDFKSLQGKIYALSISLSKKGESVTPRELRTIWFLKNNGKLTDAEFESAVNFLAIGVIMQNPKAFGVNAEQVIFGN